MACSTCKGKKIKSDVSEEKYNVIGNIGVRIFLFIIIGAIMPLTLPIMWYFIFTKLFFENKSMDLLPSITAISKRIMGKTESESDDDDDDEDISEMDFDPEELELVTQIDEIKQ